MAALVPASVVSLQRPEHAPGPPAPDWLHPTRWAAEIHLEHAPEDVAPWKDSHSFLWAQRKEGGQSRDVGALWFGVPVWALSLLRTSLRLHLLTCKTWNNADVISDICKGPGVQLILKTQRFRLASKTPEPGPWWPLPHSEPNPVWTVFPGPPSLPPGALFPWPSHQQPSPHSPPTAVSPASTPHKCSPCLLLSWICGPDPDKKDLRQLTKYTLDMMYLLSDKMKSKCVERKRKKEASYLVCKFSCEFPGGPGKKRKYNQFCES